MAPAEIAATLPRALASYPDPSGSPLYAVLLERVRIEPFNAIAAAIFALAIVHTFAAVRFVRYTHHVQHVHDERAREVGRAPTPSVRAELLHFLGEIEVVFGLWAIVLLIAMTAYAGWDIAKHYFNVGVNYTEPLFVVVIMALAGIRPIIAFAEAGLRRVASLGRCTPAAWWLTILTIGPLLGSFITEPAAMTICALLLARQFYDLNPSTRLKYATLGLLFVNVSIGGTLTHFAADLDGGSSLGVGSLTLAKPRNTRDPPTNSAGWLLSRRARHSRRTASVVDRSALRRLAEEPLFLAVPRVTIRAPRRVLRCEILRGGFVTRARMVGVGCGRSTGVKIGNVGCSTTWHSPPTGARAAETAGGRAKSVGDARAEVSELQRTDARAAGAWADETKSEPRVLLHTRGRR